MNFEEIVERTVNIEAKARPRSIIIVRDLDIYYRQGHCLSNNIVLKVLTQEIMVKDFFSPKKLKAKETKSVCINTAEPFSKNKKNRKNKKKKFQGQRREHTKERTK